jgi:hypothetical protein
METCEIGGSPTEEDCAATGVTEGFDALNRLECAAYTVALQRKYGTAPDGIAFRVKENIHDFGSYYDVICRYNPEAPEAAEYATKVENGLATWDEVGMWAPVTYSGSQPVHVIRDPDLWDRQLNSACHTTKARLLEALAASANPTL